MAWKAIHGDEVLMEKFERVWRNSGSRNKAIVAVARKLAVRLHRVYCTKEPYAVGVLT